MVVLETSCNEQYTYRVDGGQSTFVGLGDLHDTQYDHLELSTNVESLVGVDGTTDTGAQTNSQGCKYSIRVYPSEELEDSYRSDKPWIYATALAGLFVFTSVVFLLYDCMVERRQKIVLASAVQSGTLVSSLFPEAIRKQLYEEQREQAKTEDNRANWVVEPSSAMERKAAMANLYEDTTIFFADIVGFTKWSSTRTPSTYNHASESRPGHRRLMTLSTLKPTAQVFELLEALYGAFDAAAKRRGVFKVAVRRSRGLARTCSFLLFMSSLTFSAISFVDHW